MSEAILLSVIIVPTIFIVFWCGYVVGRICEQIKQFEKKLNKPNTEKR